MSIGIFVGGVWTQLPVNNLILNGSVDFERTTVTTDTTLSNSHYTVLCDATSGDITIMLPSSVGIDGRTYNIKKIDTSANSIIIDGDGSETIDGSTLVSSAIADDSFTVQSDGSNWVII